MRLCDINPFLRYAELQPSVLSGAPFSYSYDYRLFYILEGTADLVLSDKTVPLSAGMLIYFRPGLPYYFEGNVKVIVLNFDMTRAHAAQVLPRTPAKSAARFYSELIFENDPPQELADLLVIENAFSVESKMQECLLHYEYPSPISGALTSALIKEILCFLAQRSAAEQSRTHGIVQKIMLYIRQNYDKEITNSHISAEFGYHSFYLNRIFKKDMGFTIHRAVIAERIRIAKDMLLETDMPIHAVAAAVGCADHARFCTAFKAHVGQTPLQYRKNKKG